jgi:hypothetical protein
MDTADLIRLIGFGDWWSIIPGLCDDQTREWITMRLMLHTETLELADVWKCATDLGGRLAGTGSWWAAYRLLGIALSDWMLFDGWCLKRGYSPLDGPLWRVCAAVYTMAREQRVVSGKPDQTKVAWEKLHTELYAPPKSAPKAIARWTPKDEAAAFAQSMRAISASGG